MDALKKSICIHHTVMMLMTHTYTYVHTRSQTWTSRKRYTNIFVIGLLQRIIIINCRTLRSRRMYNNIIFNITYSGNYISYYIVIDLRALKTAECRPTRLYTPPLYGTIDPAIRLQLGRVHPPLRFPLPRSSSIARHCHRASRRAIRRPRKT